MTYKGMNPEPEYITFEIHKERFEIDVKGIEAANEIMEFKFPKAPKKVSTMIPEWARRKKTIWEIIFEESVRGMYRSMDAIQYGFGVSAKDKLEYMERP